MTAATQIRWRVQVRKSRAHKWRNASGLYETRRDAREDAVSMRDAIVSGTNNTVGFGNTRVVRYVKGQK
jgi:hypothetical protein